MQRKRTKGVCAFATDYENLRKEHSSGYYICGEEELDGQIDGHDGKVGALF
jgi:hypothetical protein